MAGCKWDRNLSELISKFENIKDVDLEQVVTQVAEKANNEVISEASATFPQNASKSKLVKKVKYTPSNISIEVGYKGSFDSWKHMYFHNYGYHQMYFGHDTGHMTIVHIHWFDNASKRIVEDLSDELLTKVKMEYERKFNS